VSGENQVEFICRRWERNQNSIGQLIPRYLAGWPTSQRQRQVRSWSRTDKDRQRARRCRGLIGVLILQVLVTFCKFYKKILKSNWQVKVETSITSEVPIGKILRFWTGVMNLNPQRWVLGITKFPKRNISQN